MVGPSDDEEPIRKTGLFVGNGIEQGPVNHLKLRGVPVVDTTKVIHLRLVVCVRERRARNMS